MKKPNITPGPWQQYPNCRSFVCTHDKPYKQIAECQDLEGDDEHVLPRPQVEANAQAIAALPDLLEALEQARELVALCRPRFPKSVKNPDTFKFCLADAAINKALVKAGCTL